MSKFFPRGIKPGDPISKRGVLDGILKLAHAIETMSIHGGRIDWQNDEPKIIMGNQNGLTAGRSTGDPENEGMRQSNPPQDNAQDGPSDGGGGSGGDINDSVLGIVIDNANQRVQVLARRVVRQTPNGPQTLFTLPNTYLDLSEGIVGTNTIYLNFDPDAAESAGTNPAVSFTEGAVNSYRLYGLTISESGSPAVRSASLIRVASPGDVPPHPLPLPSSENSNDILRGDGTGGWTRLAAPSTSGTWVLMVASGTMQWVAAETIVCT